MLAFILGILAVQVIAMVIVSLNEITDVVGSLSASKQIHMKRPVRKLRARAA